MKRWHIVCLALACLPGLVLAQQKPVQNIDPVANRPYPVFDTTPAITMPPLVMDVSETSAVIMWMTDAPAAARVRYGEHDLDKVAVPQSDGLVPVDTWHRVVIDGLEPGHTYQYRVESRRVVEVRPYWPEMGGTVNSDVHRFTTLDRNKREARFAFITDTHEDVGRIQALMDMIAAKPVDFVVDGGDIVNYAVDKSQLRHKFFGPVSKALKGSVPLLYVRGNHEERGAFARGMNRYLHAPEGRYYFTREAGPVHLLVVDTGEDKPDATNVYAGLNNMRDYKRRQREWFAHALQAKRVSTAPFTVILGHQPHWGWSDGHRDAWTKLANAAHVDLFIAGHDHRFGFIPAGQRGNDFPILIVGQDQVARVQADDQRIQVTVTGRDGQVVKTFEVKRRDKAG